jgi:hypothetical protein
MSHFVNEFAFGADSAYRAIVDADATGCRVVGTFHDYGLLAAIAADGATVWQKVYTIDGRVIRFWSGVPCDNGDLMLHGSLVVGSDRNQSLIVRVTADGEVRWAKAYTRDRTRFNIRLVKGLNDTYFFASWYSQNGSVDDVEVVRIDGDGAVLAAVGIDSGGDDQVDSIIPCDDGCVVCGGTSSGPGWDCFAVALDGNLRVVWKKLFGDGDFQEARHIVQADSHNFVITGETGANRHSFITQLPLAATNIRALVYDLRGGEEGGTKRLLLGAANVYLAATATAAPLASLVACFNLDLNLLWRRTLSLPGSCALLDIQDAADGAHGLLVCGFVTGGGPAAVSLLAATDSGFASCATADLPPPSRTGVEFQVSVWRAEVLPVTMTVSAQTVRARSIEPVRSEVCPAGVPLDLESNPRFQSPYVYLQAAGSDFSDRTVRGFHLRWDLLRGLGEAHLPKGDLAGPGGSWPTTIGYNRTDDFVHIYRTQRKNDYGVDVQFEKPPTSLFERGAAREWLYEDLVPFPGRATDVSIRFASVEQYDALRANLDPHEHPQQFVASYTGVIEARAVGKLAFSASFQLRPSKPGHAQRLRVEVLTLPDPLDNTSRQLGCRRSFTQFTDAAVTCENIESIRFDYTGAFPVSLHIATYEDFLYASSERREWQRVGDYSLDDGNADADAGVFRRLEEPPNVTIDGVWPKFRRVPAPGVFRVNAKNYRDRWLLPADGLKQAVITYLDASRTDVKASVVVANSDPVANTSAAELSYLDLLNFVSLDYHVARMLGLGAIDPNPTVDGATQLMYLMQYVTDARLEHETPARVTHYYMTPPVSISDAKAPPAPTISLSYGLPPEECNGTTAALTDPAGYAVFDDLRFVNLDRLPFRYELPMESFFQTADEFSLCDETVPVCFGVSYGPGPIGAGNEVQPELSNDPDWLDPAAVPEVSPIPERGTNPVYTHQERQPNVHHYRLYSINWFSRIGKASPEIQTDATQFARRNTLLPPAGFAVQLIQKEDPRIFTSLEEQNLLNLLPGDRTLVRATFDWNYVHNQAYQYADTVELYFRTRQPATVRGKIASVTENATTHTVTITTADDLIASTAPPQTVQPEIVTGDAPRFVGASLAVDGQSWLIDSVPSTGLHPTLVLKQIRTTASIDVDQDNSICTVESWLSPRPGDRFLIVENLDNPAVWDMKLAKEVALARFAPPYTETVVHNDGQSRTLFMGGLTGAALVADVPDPDPNIGGFVPAGGPTVVPSGAYTVTFSTGQLPVIADPDVSFHEGVLRMPDLSGNVKVLRVWAIQQTGSTLQLTVYDSTFGLQRDPVTGRFLLDALYRFVPVSGYVPVRTGNVGSVNFHPSYRVYLKADVSGAHNFGEPAILPVHDEGSRQTYMTARARDSSVAPALTSPMAKLTVILALELRDPVSPGPPLGPLFASRPNFYGKSTFTVDVQVDTPYSLIFFKANDRKILDQLYQPSTVRSLVAQLDVIADFDGRFTTQRWHDLVHVVTGPDDNFIEHTLNGFQFPIPDNPDYVIPDPRTNPPVVVRPFKANTTPPGSGALVGGTSRTMKDVVREAIEGAFVPLTELPLVYRLLGDSTMQTSGRPPKLRNANDDRLSPGDQHYDPWPMAVRYERNGNGDLLQSGDAGYGDPANSRWVRFTDYTIDGASKNLYFYFAVEFAITLKVSGRSPVAGPVQLMNAAPPEAPVIRKITVQLDDGNDVRTRVNFDLSRYLPSEGVTTYRLFRSLDPNDALSVRTMTEVREFPVDGGAVYDDFADLEDIPFAQPLYYRVVAFRQIVNEQGESELIPSRASNTARTNVADSLHPAPPQITMTSDPLTPAHPFTYSNVNLSWPRTTHNGRYHLYKLNDLGNWVKIYTLQSNAAIIQVDLQTTTLASNVLVKEDAAGNTLYHRFRVMVENSSGLVNLEQSELTV